MADHFFLGEQEQKDYTGLLQPVNISAAFDAVTLRIGQTIGDGCLLHTLLEVTLPDRMDLSGYVSPTGAPFTAYPFPGKQATIRPTGHLIYYAL